MASASNREMRQPIHVALLTSGVVSPTAGGAYTADDALLHQVLEALGPTDTSVVIRLVEAGQPPNAAAAGASVEVFRRRLGSRLLSRVLRHPFFWRLQLRKFCVPRSGLERRLIDAGVDLVVVCTPAMAALDWQRLPFWVAFWDLGHRDLPEFPELAQSRRFEMNDEMYRRGLTRASKILTESDASSLKIAQTYGILVDRIMVTRFVVESVDVAADCAVVTKRGLALYPAQFWPHKNHVVLLHAIKLLVEQGRTPRRLVFTGSDKGNEEYVRGVAKSLGVESWVTFAGFVSARALKELYREAAVIVMPSLLGPTNLPPLEGLLHGCGVAATHARDAQLISPQSVVEIAPFDVAGWANVLDGDLLMTLPDPNQVRQAISDRRNANIERLGHALDEFALRRSLWP
jgi:glycosyltransferase involved in cell wall biosynthesis